jgi:periplasmic copper chaperone A
MVRTFFLVAMILGAATPALAHVTIEAQEARVGTGFKAVVRVPHGCAGSATTAIRVKIPDGVIAVKPMPKPGWTLDTKTGPYGKTYAHFHNSKLSEGVTEVAWSGGTLLDAHYDEFVFTSFLSGDLQAGTTLYFPVVQECQKGVHRWIEIPAESKSEHLDQPAPAVKLLAR